MKKIFYKSAVLLGLILYVTINRAENISQTQIQNISFDASRNVFLLLTNNSSYAFGLGPNGQFINLHWGGRIDHTSDIPEPLGTYYFHQSSSSNRARFSRCEYPANMDGFYLEPCLKIEKPDKLVNLKLRFDSHEIQDNHLSVVLKPADYPFYVILHYQVYPELDLIDRWVEVRNQGKEKIVIENIQSAVWYVPHTHKYRLTHIAGTWSAEWQVRNEFLEQGEKILESRTGISGHQHVPFFALDQEGLATEKSGNVWFGTLQWSGSWKMIIEQDPGNQVRVSGGYNDYDFTLELTPGESHVTPVFTAGFTKGGFGEASRMIHRYQRKYLYPENMLNVEVPIVYNTYGSIRRERVTEENVMALIPRAAGIGVEMFIIDAGWQTAIGEWTVHPAKFPRGLKPIIDEVRRHGMKFGLWIEPERVMSDAKLFNDPDKQDWLFAKNASSAMINLSREDVLEYVYEEMARLLRENDISYDITYMMNHREAPFRFMAHIGMMGWLATSLPLDKATPEELTELKGYFDLFKKIRHITCRGELHRIASLRDHPWAAFEFVLPDAGEALLFVFGHGLQFGQRIPDLIMESLDPERIYDVEVYGEHPSPKDIYLPAVRPAYRPVSGKALMENGLHVDLAGDYESRVFWFKARN